MDKREHMHRKGFLIFIFGIVAILVLAGCTGAASQPEPEAGLETPVEAVAAETAAVQAPAAPANEATDTVEGLEPATTEATARIEEPAPEEAAPPPVREGLEATDPASVQLASGKVQLVEFFAFW